MSDPDVILVAHYPGSLEAVTEHPLLSDLRAVREGRIVVMPNRAAGGAQPVHSRRLRVSWRRDCIPTGCRRAP